MFCPKCCLVREGLLIGRGLCLGPNMEDSKKWKRMIDERVVISVLGAEVGGRTCSDFRASTIYGLSSCCGAYLLCMLKMRASSGFCHMYSYTHAERYLEPLLIWIGMQPKRCLLGTACSHCGFFCFYSYYGPLHSRRCP